MQHQPALAGWRHECYLGPNSSTLWIIIQIPLAHSSELLNTFSHLLLLRSYPPILPPVSNHTTTISHSLESSLDPILKYSNSQLSLSHLSFFISLKYDLDDPHLPWTNLTIRKASIDRQKTSITTRYDLQRFIIIIDRRLTLPSSSLPPCRSRS